MKPSGLLGGPLDSSVCLLGCITHRSTTGLMNTNVALRQENIQTLNKVSNLLPAFPLEALDVYHGLYHTTIDSI